MAEMGVQLLTARFSPFGQRVVIALEEKGVPFKRIEENLQNKSELLLQANPTHQKVPVLIHNGRSLAESNIIVEYLDDYWPADLCLGGHNLLPSTPYEKAQARFWGDFIQQKLGDPLLKMIKAKDSEIDKGAFQGNLSVLDSAISECAGQERPFFFGRHLGFVDIAFAPIISWLPSFERFLGVQVPPSSQAPRLHEWMAALQKHLTVKRNLSDPAVIETKVEDLRKRHSLT